MPLYTLRLYFGDSALEAELAEHEAVPESIRRNIWTRKRYADDDAGIVAFVQSLERRDEGRIRKVLEIRDESGRVVERPVRTAANL